MTHPSRIAAALAIAVLLAACAAPGVGTPSAPPTTEPPTTESPPSDPPSVTPAPSDPPAATPEPSVEPAPVTIAWRQLDAADAPGPREDHTWTVDPSTRVAYLFGGRDGSRVDDDLWAFDFATDLWRPIDPENPGPKARFGHEAVWVDRLGLVVWAGQAGPTTFFDDLWAYDPATNRWMTLPGDGERPLARYGSCAALGPDGRLWISHGFTEDGTRFADTRAYDFETRRWSDETPAGRAPVNRCLHGCWWTDSGELALYAGQTTGVQALGDLWTLADAGSATAAWTRADGPLPEDRNLYAFTRHGDSIVVFGGRGLGTAYHRDAFTIDATTLDIRPIGPVGSQPRARSGATLIDDPAGGRVLLFGGRTASGALDDTWQLRLP